MVGHPAAGGRQGRQRDLEARRHLRGPHQGSGCRRLELRLQKPRSPASTYIDLKPDTEYELQVRTRNVAGVGAPAFFNIRTGPTGDAGNVIPFPVH